MKSRTELIKIAAALSLRRESDLKLAAGLQALPLAPLTQTIRAMLAECKSGRIRDILSAIASLNQGRLEDLDSSEFRSYLIRKLTITEAELDTCIRALCTYARVSQAAQAGSEDLLVAARSEDDENQGTISASDVLRELRRRK